MSTNRAKPLRPPISAYSLPSHVFINDFPLLLAVSIETASLEQKRRVACFISSRLTQGIGKRPFKNMNDETRHVITHVARPSYSAFELKFCRFLSKASYADSRTLPRLGCPPEVHPSSFRRGSPAGFVPDRKCPFPMRLPQEELVQLYQKARKPGDRTAIGDCRAVKFQALPCTFMSVRLES